jgi:hypothetical protein
VILFPRARRRSPGIYWYRTRRHLKRGTEWGYVGKSNHLGLRADCHEGRCTRHPACAGGKPWSDLIVRRRQLQLPWWLGWQWITLSLETCLITLLRPRYNVQKNARRSKVPAGMQIMQREQRNQAATSGAPIYLRPSYVDLAIRAAAILMIVTGIVGALATR